MKRSNLVLLSILCVAVMLFCVLAGCVRNDDQQPTDGIIDDSFFDDPTGGSNDDPTGGSNDDPTGGSNDDPTGGSNDDPTGGSTQPPAGGNTSGDNSIMDDEENNDDYVGVPFA